MESRHLAVVGLMTFFTFLLSHLSAAPSFFFFFLLYSLQILSNFWDLLPLLLQFCWPWNQFLMGTQWPRAGPTCCIQMWPPATIRPFPTLYKHSFNILSSHALMNLHIFDCPILKCCKLQFHKNSGATSTASSWPEQQDGSKMHF